MFRIQPSNHHDQSTVRDRGAWRSAGVRPALLGWCFPLMGILLITGLVGCLQMGTAPRWSYTDPPGLSPQRRPLYSQPVPGYGQNGYGQNGNSRRQVITGRPTPAATLENIDESTLVPIQPLEIAESTGGGVDSANPLNEAGEETDPMVSADPATAARGPEFVLPAPDPNAFQLEVQMPPRRVIDSRFQSLIRITNNAEHPIPDVMIDVQLGEGLKLPGRADRHIRQSIGDLAPGEERQLPLLIECTQPGELCADFGVYSDSIQIATANVCIRCIEQTLDLQVFGPARRTIGARAEFQARVTNPSDKPIETVQLQLRPSEFLTVAALTAGYTREGRSAKWDLGTLQPGETVQIQAEYVCDTISERNFLSAIVLTGTERVNEEELQLEVEPISGNLDLQIADAEDPIGIGDTTAVMVSVTNRGQLPMTDLLCSVKLPDIVRVESVDIEVDGQTTPLQFNQRGESVEFAPLASLAANSTLVLRLNLKAWQTGDLPAVASATHANRSVPVTAEEYLSVIPDATTAAEFDPGQ